MLPGVSAARTGVGAGDILVVDDDVDIRESLAALLAARGYRVRTCANGREAVAAIERTRPALVVLDLMMPVMSGWELVEWVREFKAISVDRLLVMSAGDELVAGVPVVHKPFDIANLLAKIRDQLCGRT